MSTITVPQPITSENSVSFGPNVMDDAHSDIEYYTYLLQNELQNENELAENRRTQRLTEKQKQLLPLLAQLVTAHSTYMLLEVVEILDK